MIPPDSLEAILGHAFLKGSKRIGRSTTQSPERKALLAVEAHIRHTHTQYEKLLRNGLDRDSARQRIRGETQKIKNEWAGSADRKLQAVSGDGSMDIEIIDLDTDVASDIESVSSSIWSDVSI